MMDGRIGAFAEAARCRRLSIKLGLLVMRPSLLRHFTAIREAAESPPQFGDRFVSMVFANANEALRECLISMKERTS